MKKGKELYRGKAKTMYLTDDPNVLYCEFRNDISAFNAVKVDSLADKGKTNNFINEHIMQRLEENNLKTHFIKRVDETGTLVRNLEMLPVECIVRNMAAGSICKRLGVAQKAPLTPPVFEFCYKNDALGDPLINESHILSFKWATQSQIDEMKRLTFSVNELLSKLFDEIGFILADYKLEFGVFEGNILLADEFTPDGCRLWDKETHEIYDKDRFRQDLGSVVEYYKVVAERLGIDIK